LIEFPADLSIEDENLPLADRRATERLLHSRRTV
jgi:hypothetical protein